MIRAVLATTVCLLAIPVHGQRCPFPSAQGTTWIYEVVGHAQDPSGGAVREWHKQVEMRIEKSRSDGDAVVLLLHHSILDLDMFTGTFNAEWSLLVLGRDGRALSLQLNHGETGIPNSAVLARRMESAEQVLAWPLSPGLRFGRDPEAANREDELYEWVVEANPAPTLAVVGWRGEKAGFSVAYRTNPDSREAVFIPDLGLARLAVEHHGTIADFEARLVRFECQAGVRQ